MVLPDRQNGLPLRSSRIPVVVFLSNAFPCRYRVALCRRGQALKDFGSCHLDTGEGRSSSRIDFASQAVQHCFGTSWPYAFMAPCDQFLRSNPALHGWRSRSAHRRRVRGCLRRTGRRSDGEVSRVWLSGLGMRLWAHRRGAAAVAAAARWERTLLLVALVLQRWALLPASAVVRAPLRQLRRLVRTPRKAQQKA